MLTLVVLLGLLVACRPRVEVSPATMVAPTLAPTPCTGRLDVKADPPGATILIDGWPVGQSPLQLPLAPGPHLVDLQADGYASYMVTVHVLCGQVEELKPQLYDNTPPVLHVETVPQTVAPDDGLKITASSTDNHAVASMALYVDGRLIYQLERDRLRHNLDTRALATGPHVLRLLATDVSGNVQERAIAFSVAPDAEPASEALNLATATASPAPTASATSQAAVSPDRTATPASTPLPTSPPAPTAQPAVAVFEEQVTLTLYDYVPALYVDEGAGHPYPLLHHDEVGAPINRTFQTIVLQNEYLELVILPELGGRIYQCRFLPTGQPLLYNSRVAKPTHWGPSDQGWWLALGGIEFALPVDEHGYLTAQPWDASVTRQGDGGATVVLQIQEATRGLRARVEVTLRPGEAAIRLRTSLFNASGVPQQFQYWTNAMLSPGRHGVGPELQITFPADQVVVHSTGDTSLPPAGATMTWPVYAGRDLSSYAEWRNWLGFFGPQRWAPFVAVYDQATQIGMVHASTAGVLAGSKVFGFGRNFDDRTYSDDGAQYIEIWSGLTRSFDQYTSLPAGGTVAWNEVWYVVSQSGGVTFANQNASLYAWRDGDVIRLTVTAPSEHRWHLTAAQNGTLISDQVFDVCPDTPFRATLSPEAHDAGSPIEITILDLGGASLLEYGF
ncbi:MAG: DUF5107 domain-containing protein [Anaerolineae bacterium]